MTSLDFLYWALGIGFLVLVGFISYAFFQLGKTMRSARSVLEDIRDITCDLRIMKNYLKAGLKEIFMNFARKGRSLEATKTIEQEKVEIK